MCQLMTTPEQDKARTEGMQAQALEECPYTIDTHAYRWWQVGRAIGRWNSLWQSK